MLEIQDDVDEFGWEEENSFDKEETREAELVDGDKRKLVICTIHKLLLFLKVTNNT